VRKITVGILKQDPKNGDIVSFIKEVGQRFEILKDSTHINLVYNLPEDPVYFWYDTKKLEQVLNNLLSNAFKNTTRDGQIIVSLDKNVVKLGEKNFLFEGLEISVFNEGKAIPEDKKEKIFERFYQINSTGSSGIGLALTKSLVELHNGTISVESESGKGVNFKVFLSKGEGSLSKTLSTAHNTSNDPVYFSEEKEEQELLAITDPIKVDKDLKVLIIEDNEELRNYLKNKLSEYFECEAEKNGELGLKVAFETIPDIIISDVLMPKKNGFEVCKEIKENIRTCHIPVLLLTAKGAPDHIVTGYNSGADAYVVKPFENRILLSQIQRLIKNRELIREKFKKQNFMVEVSPKLTSKNDLFLQKIKEEIEKNINDPDFNVNQLSQIINLSNTQLYRKIKAVTGYTAVEFIRFIKLNKAAELLKTNKHSVKEVCFMSGFNDPSYFNRCFKENFKVTPAEFKLK